MEFSTQIILVYCALFVLKVLTLSVSGPTSDHAHQTKSSNEFSELDSHAQREHNDVLEASKTLFMMANDHRGNTHDTIKNIKKYHYNKPPKQTKEEQRKNQREYRRAKRAAMSLEQRRASYRKDHEDRKRKRAKVSKEYFVIILSLSLYLSYTSHSLQK